MNGWRNLWCDQRLLVAVFVLLAIIISVDKYYRRPLVLAGSAVTRYNNYVIFKNAGEHLANNQDMYQAWPTEQWDLYKYSPTFAAAMWPFTLVPDLVGLCVWNVAGALALLYALRALPLSAQATAGAAWIVLKDLVTNLQNAQSNGLVAAVMILSCVYWERKRLAAAALALSWAFYIKIFGVAVALLWLLYPAKMKSAAWVVGVGTVLAIAPLLLTTPDILAQQYDSWLNMLSNDHANSLGMSVMGIMSAWFGIQRHKSITVLIAGLILVAPLVRRSQYANPQFRLGMLASVLMWVVLFNHKAESPTFVIASSGVAVWFVSRPITLLNSVLLALTVLLSGFASSDLVPDWIQDQLIERYQVKALPSFLVWLKLQCELWLSRSAVETTTNNQDAPQSRDVALLRAA